MNSIVDTHRVLYKNAKIRAWDKAMPTVPLHFFDADGRDLGTTVTTNNEGYISISGGTGSSTGVFLEKQAIVNVSLDGGLSWPIEWVTDQAGSGSPNDGHLKNKNGVSVWSADSQADYELDYNDLKNTPRLGSWKETEQVVTVKMWAEVIEVLEHTTVLRIVDYDPCTQAHGNCSYRKAVCLRFKRPGQQVFVINDTTADISFWSSPNIPEPGKYDGCICVLNGHENTMLGSKKVFGDADTYDYEAIVFDYLNYADQKEQLVEVEAWGQMVYVDPTTSVLRVVNKASDRLGIQLVFNRPGQVCQVINIAGHGIDLWMTPVPPKNGDYKPSVTLYTDNSTVIGTGHVTDTNVLRWWAIDKQQPDVSDRNPASPSYIKNLPELAPKLSYGTKHNVSESEPLVYRLASGNYGLLAINAEIDDVAMDGHVWGAFTVTASNGSEYYTADYPFNIFVKAHSKCTFTVVVPMPGIIPLPDGSGDGCRVALSKLCQTALAALKMDCHYIAQYSKAIPV